VSESNCFIILEVVSSYIDPQSDACTGKWVYEGSTTNETDAETVEIQKTLAESLPRRCIEWRRIRIPESDPILVSLLGSRYEDARAASERSYAVCENSGGRIHTSINVNVFPGGEMIINDRDMGNTREKESEIMVRDFIIESRMAF